MSVTHPNLLDYYRAQCNQQLIINDEHQLAVLHQLQNIYHQLIAEHHSRKRFPLLRKPKMVKGAYLWGSVGNGKTFMMDCFYHCLPFPNKMRIHFHQFMRYIHQELKNNQGKKDPLTVIAKEIAKSATVVCFDELQVDDIADAMILARLFDTLLFQGTCFLITANVPPEDLYKNGLQRSSFLPVIELIKKKTSVIHVPSTIDYRQRHLEIAGAFYVPNDEIADQNMAKSFSLLQGSSPSQTGEIAIYGRSIPIIKRAGDMIWFDFKKICGVPRSQQDYLAIVEKYKTIFISNVPNLTGTDKNTISLFIRMIDVFYDAHVRLICSAENILPILYSGEHMKFEYARTLSRLLEMQSENYFFHRK